MISIVTPWLNAPELIPIYEVSTRGAEIIIVDNGSRSAVAYLLKALCGRAGGTYIRNEYNALFSHANNQGLEAAHGEIVVFMNNDVQCRDGFLAAVERDTVADALCGPSLLSKYDIPYIEGWCISGRRETWQQLGGWDDQYYKGLYWEDNDLSFRAQQAGIKLVQTYWPVWHHNNYTSSKTPGAFDHSGENETLFLQRVQQWQK